MQARLGKFMPRLLDSKRTNPYLHSTIADCEHLMGISAAMLAISNIQDHQQHGDSQFSNDSSTHGPAQPKLYCS